MLAIDRVWTSEEIKQMSYEVDLVRANKVTQELTKLATINYCATLQEAEELARDLNESEWLQANEFYMSVEREDEEDE